MKFAAKPTPDAWPGKNRDGYLVLTPPDLGLIKTPAVGSFGFVLFPGRLEERVQGIVYFVLWGASGLLDRS